MPVAFVKKPASHGVQSGLPLSFSSLKNCPGKHSTQNLLPMAFSEPPPTQVLHSVAAATAENEPSLQGRQPSASVLAPPFTATPRFPGKQGVQSPPLVIPRIEFQVPVSHARQYFSLL